MAMGICPSIPQGPPGSVTFEEECFTSDLGHRIKVGSAPVRHVLLGPARQNMRGPVRESTRPKHQGELRLPES